MNKVIIADVKVREAAAAGLDEFVNLFADAAIDSVGGQLNEETDGGFVQLIYNGFGPFIFFNPFAKAVRAWGLDDLAALVNKAGKLFRKHGRDIQRDCSDEEFMALFEQYPEFDDLDDNFVENEERWVEEVARYIDGHIDSFAEITEG